jgi:hypothetical protein
MEANRHAIKSRGGRAKPAETAPTLRDGRNSYRSGFVKWLAIRGLRFSR